jgi:hypothetical protein
MTRTSAASRAPNARRALDAILGTATNAMGCRASTGKAVRREEASAVSQCQVFYAIEGAQ